MKLRQKLLASTAAAVLAANILSPAASAQTSSAALIDTDNPVVTSSVVPLVLAWFGWCMSSNVVNEGSCYF